MQNSINILRCIIVQPTLKKPFFYLMEIIVNNGNWDLFLPKVLLLFFFRKTNEKTKRQEKYALHNAFVNSLFVMGVFMNKRTNII